MLLAIEGFEGFGTTTASDITTYLAEKFSDVSAGPFYLDAGRYFGFSIYSSDTDQSQTIPFYTNTEDPTIVMGFNFFCNAVTPVALIIFYAGTTPTLACTIKWSTVTAGELSIYDYNDTLLGTTSGAGLALGTKWHYVEAKVICNASTGNVIIKVDEKVKLELDNINTSNSSSDTAYSKVSVVVANQYRMDDFYIADGTGFNNDFLGEKAVVGCLPIGDTDTIEWTPSTGTTHYDLVNENPADGDTTYVSDYGIGYTDLYQYSIDPNVTVISGIQINTISKQISGSTVGGIKGVVGFEGYADDEVAQIVSSSYSTKIRIIEEKYLAIPYCKKITISHTNVADTLIDFPLCVKIEGDTDIGAICLSSGDDIFFTDADFNVLYAELNSPFTVSSGAASGIFWVKIPKILSTADTMIYCFYGNKAAAARTGMTSVWNADFQNVYHFGTSSSLILTDSTINANTATSTSVTATDGKFDGGANFNGSAYLTIPTASLIGTPQFTISYWVNITTLGDGGIFSKGNWNAWENDMLFVMDGSYNQWYQIDYGADGGPNIGTNPYSTNTWYRYSVVYDGTQTDADPTIQNNKRVKIWRNGIQQTLDFAAYNAPATTSPSMPVNGNLGQYMCNNGFRLRGKLDEVHISNTAYSSAWVVFEYCNQSSGEITWGEQTTPKWSATLFNRVGIGIKI
jgi:hypothetical protein